MNVYVENQIAAASTLNATNLETGYTVSSLYSKTLSDPAVFADKTTTITAAWGVDHYCDAIALMASNWTKGYLTITFDDGTEIDNEYIETRGDNSVIKLPAIPMTWPRTPKPQITSMTLKLEANDNLVIGFLYAGERLELPLFKIEPKYTFGLQSGANRTQYGIIYGRRLPSLRSFSCELPELSNYERGVVQAYADRVQTVVPHIIEPYDVDGFPPFYGTIDSLGDFQKKSWANFHWSGALSWTEAR